MITICIPVVSQCRSCWVSVAGQDLARMPPLPHTDTCDEERKKELIMEKKLRACRVNIISRVSKSISVSISVSDPT